ncbi:MAG: hypothetical protein KF849_16940 [Rhizobiaceae bacterium]|nr:hypothetical protein [Rhizobiaceae bacterium]
MTPEQDWSTIAARKDADDAAGALGSLRIALLFGAGAIAFALIAAPLAERSARTMVAGSGGLDTMSTGAISGSAGGNYTIRRSVLQPNPNSVCIISANGTRRGEC